MTEKARGMPDMSLKKETIERLEAEAKAEEPEEEEKIFQKPGVNLEINGKIEEPTQNEVEEPAPILKKEERPKRKVSQKQLDALKRGREKSLEVRRARSAANKESNNPPVVPKIPKNHVKKDVEPKPMPQQTMSQTSPVNIIQPSIDYDKIINGVANRWHSLHQPATSYPSHLLPTIKEMEPKFDQKAFEKKIREDEKIKILNEITRLQDEEEREKNMKTTHQVLSRNSAPPPSANPFSYAFDMNARNRFQRY
jgi:hypothetical protein